MKFNLICSIVFLIILSQTSCWEKRTKEDKSEAEGDIGNYGGDPTGYGKEIASVPYFISRMAASMPTYYKDTAEKRGSEPEEQLTDSSEIDQEIYWLLWNLAREEECLTGTYVNYRNCFRTRLSDESEWQYFKMPYISSTPMALRVAGQIDLKTMGNNQLVQLAHLEHLLIKYATTTYACQSSPGISCDMTKYLPWASEWGVATSLKFQGGSGTTYDSAWFGIGTAQTGVRGTYALGLSSDENEDNTQMLFAYLEETKEIVHISIGSQKNGGIGLNAFLGNLTVDAKSGGLSGMFEALKIAKSDDGYSVMRMKSSGQYLWVQVWQKPPWDPLFNSSIPDKGLCYQISRGTPLSQAVSSLNCESALNSAHNMDYSYRFRLAGEIFKSHNWLEKTSEMYHPINQAIGSLLQCY